MTHEPVPRRLAQLAPADLSPDQTELYNELAGGRRATGPQYFRLIDDQGRLEGPFNAFLYSPALGSRLQALGAAIRYDSSLDSRHRELAILVVAAVSDSDFERYAHEPIARAAGVTDAELAAIRRGPTADTPLDTPLDWPDPIDRAVVTASRQLATTFDLDEAHYAAAVAALGDAGVFELTTLVGYYRTLAMQLRVFAVPTPTD